MGNLHDGTIYEEAIETFGLENQLLELISVLSETSKYTCKLIQTNVDLYESPKRIDDLVSGLIELEIISNQILEYLKNIREDNYSQIKIKKLQELRIKIDIAKKRLQETAIIQ